jgi:hypothetical protein
LDLYHEPRSPPLCPRSSTPIPTLALAPTGPFANPIKLEIRIISGQQLPKPKGAKKGEVIDPYVKVEIFGVPADHKALATKHIDDNGTHPHVGLMKGHSLQRGH